jgi:hypothetical protein
MANRVSKPLTITPIGVGTLSSVKAFMIVAMNRAPSSVPTNEPLPPNRLAPPRNGLVKPAIKRVSPPLQPTWLLELWIGIPVESLASLYAEMALCDQVLQ